MTNFGVLAVRCFSDVILIIMFSQELPRSSEETGIIVPPTLTDELFLVRIVQTLRKRSILISSG